MSHLSKNLSSGCWARPDDLEAEAISLLEQGIGLCRQWEELAERQFLSLGAPDGESFSAVQAAQLGMAERFCQLEARWQEVQRALPSVHRQPSSRRTVLRARRLEFIAAAQHVSVTNQRNARALGALLLLGATCEAMAAPGQQPTYDQRGCRVAGGLPQVRSIDREG